MKISPEQFIIGYKNLKFRKKIFLISGNEESLIKKIEKILILELGGQDSNQTKKIVNDKLDSVSLSETGDLLVDSYKVINHINPEDINLSEIIQITDSTFELVECVHDEDLCKVHQSCPTRRPLIAIHQKIKQFVEETTLAAIIEDAETNNFSVEDPSYETAHLS